MHQPFARHDLGNHAAFRGGWQRKPLGRRSCPADHEKQANQKTVLFSRNCKQLEKIHKHKRKRNLQGSHLGGELQCRTYPFLANLVFAPLPRADL